LLNLGHTPAHGVEKLSNYTITHGRAVAMGLKIMINGSYKKGFLSVDDYNKITSVLGEFLPDCNFNLVSLASTAFYDKKRNGDTIDIITIHGIGDCRITKVDFNNLKEYF
jgi:3-dehydroquinate synthase